MCVCGGERGGGGGGRANPLTQNTTVSAAGISVPQKSSHCGFLSDTNQATCLAFNANQKVKQTASFGFFTPLKLPKPSTKLYVYYYSNGYYNDVKRSYPSRVATLVGLGSAALAAAVVLL